MSQHLSQGHINVTIAHLYHFHFSSTTPLTSPLLSLSSFYYPSPPQSISMNKPDRSYWRKQFWFFSLTNLVSIKKPTWIWWWRWPPSPPGRPSPSSTRRCCSAAASPLSCPDTWDVSFSPITIPTCSVVQSLTEDEAYINWIQAGLLSHRNHIIHFQVPYSQGSSIM